MYKVYYSACFLTASTRILKIIGAELRLTMSPLPEGSSPPVKGGGGEVAIVAPFFSFGIQAGAKNDKRKISGGGGARARSRLRKSGTRLAAARAAASARLFLLCARLPAGDIILPTSSSLPVPPHQTECVPLRRGRTHTRFSQFRMVRRTTHYRE